MLSLSTDLTKGMSRMEVWIVFWSALCSKRELRRLAVFFQERSR